MLCLPASSGLSRPLFHSETPAVEQETRCNVWSAQSWVDHERMLTWQILVLGSGRILNYFVKKEKVGKEQKMEAKRKAQPSSTAERVLWWLPIPRPSVSLLLKHSKWNKVSGHVMWNLYWSFSSPAHTISRGNFTETAAGDVIRSRRTFILQRSGSDTRTSAHGTVRKGHRSEVDSQVHLSLWAVFPHVLRVWKLPKHWLSKWFPYH